MILFFETYAVAIVTVILVVCAGVFFVLILYTTLHRIVLNRRIRLDQEAEDRVQPLIYDYLAGEISGEHISEKLSKQYEIMVAYHNIIIMIDNLDGEERKKLRALLELPEFRSYYFHKLRSRRSMNIAQACMYFSRKTVIEEDAVHRLIKLQGHSYNIIAYASTLALINSGNRQVRDAALLRFLYRRQNASMAVSDIIFKYYDKYPDKEEVSEKLVFYVMDDAIPDKTRAAIILMFPNFGFYQYARNLHELLVMIMQEDQAGILTAALVRVLFELSDEHIEAEIQRHRLWDSPFQHVRLEVARVYAEQTGPSYRDVLLNLAHDPDMEVRILAQKALLNIAAPSLPDDAFAPEILPEWKEMKKSREAYVNTL